MPNVNAPNPSCLEKVVSIYQLSAHEMPAIREDDLRKLHPETFSQARNLKAIQIGSSFAYLIKNEMCSGCQFSGVRIDELLVEKYCGNPQVLSEYLMNNREQLLTLPVAKNKII